MRIFQPTKPTSDEPSGLGRQGHAYAKATPKSLTSAVEIAPSRHLLLGLLGFLCLLASVADGGSWSSRLADGKRIQVDPNTNRVTVFRDADHSQPLWDGVHRLEDGSTITIRSGVMVPNKAVVELRHRLPSTEVAAPGAPCQQLVRKVCGLHDECAKESACGPARQLLRMSQDEAQEASELPEASTGRWALDQCQQALADEAYFVPCARLQRGKKPTPCEQLFDKVCGAKQQCRQQQRCSLARQMLDMEAEERRAAIEPDALTFTSDQCREALGDEEFFNPCKP